jgi:hypothetical protein
MRDGGSTLKYVRIVLAVLAVLCVLPATAQAYIDPTSTAILWQALLAAIVGAMFYIRAIVTRVKRLITRIGLLRSKTPEPTEVNH